MILYAESSAVLSWLMGEKQGEAVRGALSHSELVMASDLTLIECERVLIRAVASARITEVEAADRKAVLSSAAAHWNLLHVTRDVVERACRAFPCEPVRTLDALHLASALVLRGPVPGVKLLSLDARVRKNGAALGFSVVP